MSACPEPDVLLDFLEQRLSPSEVIALDRHLTSCTACQHVVVQAVRVGGMSAAWGLTAPPPDSNGADAEDAGPPLRIDEYRHVRVLGVGGMGQVHLYMDTALNREVAIKFLGRRSGPAERERFRIEAQAAARVAHPNVVAVYRVGEVGGQPFLVSERIAGQALSNLPLPLPWREVLRIAILVTRGLDAAHRKGVLHRDIKPANVLMDPDGLIKLCDFGLAKLVHLPGPGDPLLGAAADTAGRMTAVLTEEPHAIMTAAIGTPAYMSPETWRGHRATPQTDIYSLGVMLYELCAGHTLYPECNGLDGLRRVIGIRGPTSLRARAPQAEPRMCAIIERCIERSPADRFNSAAELLETLQSLDAAVTLVKDEPVTPLDSGARSALLDRVQRPRPRRAALWLALGASLALPDGGGWRPDYVVETLRRGAQERHFLLVVPKTAQRGPWPAIIAVHSDENSRYPSPARLREALNLEQHVAEPTVFVYPERRWYRDGVPSDYNNLTQRGEEVVFLRDLIEDLTRRQLVRRGHVMLLGFGGGANIVDVAACALGRESVRAVALFAGHRWPIEGIYARLPDGRRVERCDQGPATMVLWGTKDRIPGVEYERVQRDQESPREEALRRHLSDLGCDPKHKTLSTPCEAYERCREPGQRLTFCSLGGLGHELPKTPGILVLPWFYNQLAATRP